MTSSVADSATPEIVSTRPHGVALAAFILLAIAAGIAYFVSGLYSLLVLVLTPKPGAEAYILVLKAVFVVGWLAIGWWLLLDFWRGRWRFVAAPVAAWAWVFGHALLTLRSVYLLPGH